MTYGTPLCSLSFSDPPTGPQRITCCALKKVKIAKKWPSTVGRIHEWGCLGSSVTSCVSRPRGLFFFPRLLVPVEFWLGSESLFRTFTEREMGTHHFRMKYQPPSDPSTCYFDGLPSEIFDEILEYFTCKPLCTLSMVNKNFYFRAIMQECYYEVFFFLLWKNFMKFWSTDLFFSGISLVKYFREEARQISKLLKWRNLSIDICPIFKVLLLWE